MRLLFLTILMFLLTISVQATAQIEAPAPFFPALVPTLGSANLWGTGSNNFEQGCTISAVGSPGTFTPTCSVNYITITASNQIIAVPTYTVPAGSTGARKSIEIIISYSGAFKPIFAAGYAWPAGAFVPQCSTTITTGCVSAATGLTDWLECRSIDATHVGCGLPIAGIQGVGACDTAGIGYAWWGLRACGFANLTGSQKGINIRRASDNTTTDVLILATGGLDVATATTFCASTTCFLTRMYDQTGHSRDLVQATNANQPQLTFSCLGSFPCIAFSGSQWFTVTTTATSQPLSLAAVVERTGNPTAFASIIGGNAGTGSELGFNNSAGNMYIYAAGAADTEPAAESTFHAFVGVFNDTSSAINVDGTDFPTLSGSPGTGGLTTATSVGARSSAPDFQLTGNIIELGIWTSALPVSTRTTLTNNAHSAYGF